MATECLTGYTGTANISSDDLVEVIKAIFGSDKFVLSTAEQMAISVASSTGTVSIKPGTFSFNGLLGRIKIPENVNYAIPASDTLYKKICVCIKYTKDAETSIDTMALFALESEEKETESQAESVNVLENIVTSLEYGKTLEAYFPLWSFTCNASTANEPEQLFEVIDSLQTLHILYVMIQNKTINAETQSQRYVQNLSDYIQQKTVEINSFKNQVNAKVSEMQEYVDNIPSKLYDLSKHISKDGDSYKFDLGSNRSVSLGLYNAYPAIIFKTETNEGCIYLNAAGSLMKKNGSGITTTL